MCPDPYDLGPEGLARLLDDQPAYRARQVWAWLLRGVDDARAMTDLPKGLRERLADTLAPPAGIVRHTTADGGLTRKVLLEYQGGDLVEAVLMLYPRQGERRHGRATVCVSTQAGCAMACPFCATGQAGFRRQLTFGEVARQVTVMQRLLGSSATASGSAPPGSPGESVLALRHITNVVFMGMGEPLANLDVTARAVEWLASEDGFGLSARSITVSTVGLVPGIRRLARLGLPVTLAVSLHAPNDALRDDLVPVNRQFPLADLLDAVADYRAATGRRVTFEYILIKGVNDALDHADELAVLVAGFGAHVNLIPMNPTPGIDWQAPPPAHQRAFARVLERRGVSATVRHNRGGDIDAACGQLYADYALASGRMLPAARAAWERWEVGVR
jgi:23S rRNA (adenine2503-C2)-methyltransferase